MERARVWTSEDRFWRQDWTPNWRSTDLLWGFLCVPVVKNPPAMQETQLTWFWSLGWEIPWRRNWLPNPVFLPGKSHGQRSLVGYGGLRGSDTTEHAYRPVLFGLPIFFSSGKFHMKNWLLQKSPNIWQHPVPVCAATSGAKPWPRLSSLARKHWWAGWQYKMNPVPRWFSQFL